VSTHFIADLHLQASKPELTAIFNRYLAGPARDAHTLYILGDLFEYWIGDDGSLPEHRDNVDALAALAESGVHVFFMRGNRDFAVGPEFARTAGLRIIDDPLLIDLYGMPTLLTHGDVLCTDDIEHQRFRAKYSDPAWRRRMLKLPKFLRRQIARSARAKSQYNTRNLSEEIMDVNELAVRNFMQEYGASRLIHGHTHRPQIHDVALKYGNGERYVLPDWHERQGGVLICDEHGCRQEKLI